MENSFIQKSPSIPLCQRGKMKGKRIPDKSTTRRAGMTKETKINFIDTPQLAVGRFNELLNHIIGRILYLSGFFCPTGRRPIVH
jgi:hypothetical protein